MMGEDVPYPDEELSCEFIEIFDAKGVVNVCAGNEPYRCHRAKAEGLCHKSKG